MSPTRISSPPNTACWIDGASENEIQAPYVAWVERSDKITEGDFGQPKAGPQGGVHEWTPQTRVSLRSTQATLQPPICCQHILQAACLIDSQFISWLANHKIHMCLAITGANLALL